MKKENLKEIPVNKIDSAAFLEKEKQNFFSFKEHLKEKFQIKEETMTILELLSLEEFLALKIESVFNIFNGKIAFPVEDIIQFSMPKIVTMITKAYDDDKKMRMIRGNLLRGFKRRIHFQLLNDAYSQYRKYDKTK